MDPVKKLNENFLSCSICTDRFTDPCTLGCGHTFCRKCLGEFLKTQQEAVMDKYILCPYCRQMTKPPDPDKPVEDWPKQMKPHFLIQGLLDDFAESAAPGACAQAAAVITGTECFPCQKIGKTVRAGCFCQECDIPLCGDCAKIHHTMPASNQHTISGLQEEAKAKVRPHRKNICCEHNSAVELCCKDCNKAICSICCINYHRKCDSVVTIESMVTEMKSAVTDKKLSIMYTMEEMQINLALQRSLIENTDEYKLSVQLEIGTVSQQAVDQIKQKEERLIEELDELVEKRVIQLKSQIRSSEVDLEMYQQYSELLDQTLESESPMDLFDVYQKCQTRAVTWDVDKQNDVSARSASMEITFTDKLQLQAFRNGFELGKLKLSQDNTGHKTMPLLRNLGSLQLHDDGCRVAMTPELYGTIDTKIDGDQDFSRPFEVTVLDVDGVLTVVVTDCGNNSLKSFYYREDQSCSSILKLYHEPRAVSQLKDNLVVVSFLSHNEFLIVQVTPDLVLLSTVKTQKKYQCLTALSPSTLAACCINPPYIDIIDVTGRFKRSLIQLKTGQGLTKSTWLLSTTKHGDILVSDSKSRYVYCLTQEGEVMFEYHFGGDMVLSYPGGITTTASGDILIVDAGNHKVIQLTEDGQFVKNLLTSQDGLKSPNGICHHRHMLYIAEWNQGIIKVFQFQ